MSLRVLYSDGTLVAAGANAVSGWLSVGQYDQLRISSTATGGIYALELDHGRDGSTSDYTEAITTANNAAVSRNVVLPYVRVRIKNTGAAAFTAHRTTAAGYINAR